MSRLSMRRSLVHTEQAVDDLQLVSFLRHEKLPVSPDDLVRPTPEFMKQFVAAMVDGYVGVSYEAVRNHVAQLAAAGSSAVSEDTQRQIEFLLMAEAFRAMAPGEKVTMANLLRPDAASTRRIVRAMARFIEYSNDVSSTPRVLEVTQVMEADYEATDQVIRELQQARDELEAKRAAAPSSRPDAPSLVQLSRYNEALHTRVLEARARSHEGRQRRLEYSAEKERALERNRDLEVRVAALAHDVDQLKRYDSLRISDEEAELEALKRSVHEAEQSLHQARAARDLRRRETAAAHEMLPQFDGLMATLNEVARSIDERNRLAEVVATVVEMRRRAEARQSDVEQQIQQTRVNISALASKSERFEQSYADKTARLVAQRDSRAAEYDRAVAHRESAKVEHDGLRSEIAELEAEVEEAQRRHEAEKAATERSVATLCMELQNYFAAMDRITAEVKADGE
ncbi:probable kinetochore protein Nuf2p [Diutina catenulata]